MSNESFYYSESEKHLIFERCELLYYYLINATSSVIEEVFLFL